MNKRPAQACHGRASQAESGPKAITCGMTNGRTRIAAKIKLHKVQVMGSYFPATRLPSTTHMAKPSEPQRVTASPRSVGERCAKPVLDARMITPAREIAIPLAL